MGIIRYTEDVPPLVSDIAPGLVSLLGLGQWEIYIRMVKKPGGKNAIGSVQINHAYHWAIIRLKRGLSDELLRQSFLHELLHVALWRMPALLAQLEAILSRKEWRLVCELARVAEEQTVELLRRSLNKAGIGMEAKAAPVEDKPQIVIDHL